MTRELPFDAQDSRWHRLTAVDGAFLAIEGGGNLLHIGATTVFEPGILTGDRGRVDEERYLEIFRAVLERLPKFRMRLARVPLLGHPVLVSDPSFDVRRHVHFVHLQGGSLRDVEDLAGKSYSTLLDRERPLWEQLVIDGLEGGRFATVVKLHHAMADGVAGLGALASMLSSEPNATPPRVALADPVTPPSGRELLGAELRWRTAEPAALLERARAAMKDGETLVARTRKVAGSVGSAFRAAKRAPATFLNPRRLGPHREYRGLRLDLEDVKAVRRAAGTKLNDVVLAIVAGALEHYLARHGAPLGGRPLRCMVPVSLHESSDADVAGNEVSLMLMPLPIDAMDPRRRLELVANASRTAKRERQSSAFALGEELAEWTFAPLVPWVMRVVVAFRPYNLIVTNIPGPPFPLYLLDSKATAIYPMVPLYGNQALGIALVSYDGSLFWGLSADRARLHDLDALVDALDRSFEDLCAAYGAPHALPAE